MVFRPRNIAAMRAFPAPRPNFSARLALKHQTKQRSRSRFDGDRGGLARPNGHTLKLAVIVRFFIDCLRNGKRPT
jgi:hypothetical protein